jgi:phospholipid/cholesterol/gamma-HCH transport system substrate-binding protein
VDNLRVVSDRMARGEGTLGRLTKDDKLYREAEGLIGDVRETVDNLRESTPLSTFGSILMGGM